MSVYTIYSSEYREDTWEKEKRIGTKVDTACQENFSAAILGTRAIDSAALLHTNNQMTNQYFC